MNLLPIMWPELLLGCVGGLLFLVGVVNRPTARKLAPVLAIAALLVVFAGLVMRPPGEKVLTDVARTFRVYEFAHYIKLLSAGVGILLVLLAWPTRADGTGNSALEFGTEAGEFFGLMLFSLCGIFLVAGSNDLILLFLAIELASIPTYIMVSVSRPLPVAQEAGVKYFFLGAMSAAVMLFGFSYLYGTTGTTDMSAIAAQFRQTAGAAGAAGAGGVVQLSAWQMLAVVMLIAGFAFKIAAVPLHFYAGDVYQGAATPVTAFLSFVPKTSGLVALIKILFMIGGGAWDVSPQVAKLIWILAFLTMTVGNVLGLMAQNVKRMLAFSSVAHSGYMLVGVATLIGSHDDVTQSAALG